MNKTRLYSLCLAGNRKMTEKHLMLLENIDKLERNDEVVSVQLSDN